MIISIHPNPVVSAGKLKIQSRESQEVEVKVYTMKGKLVITKKAYIEAGEAVIPIYTLSWPAGLYIIKCINAKGEVYHHKVLKVK
jgi:hypothetical protein